MPEFIKILRNSQPISISKGKFHFLARISKPRKDQEKNRQLEDEKTNNYYKSKVIKLEIKKLKVKIKIQEDQNNDAEDNIKNLSKLYSTFS